MPTRIIFALIAASIPLLSILWAFQVPLYLGMEVARVQFLAFLLGLAVTLVFLKPNENSTKTARAANYTVAVVALGVYCWIAIDYQRYQFDFPYLTLEMQLLGATAVVLALEAIRRTTGWILLALIATFLLYALLGNLIPAPLTGNSVTIQEIAVYLGFDPNAMLGTPLSVVATIVVVFIFFGNLLVRTGCGEFFIDLALAGMGGRRGGAAKISIVGSALFGSISGSAVSNVVSTGVMTIPLMRRSGYNARQAGAIEAVASTGGQLMPPIMGAAAFLMAQALEIPYTEVMAAALIPALLYYISVFIQVDLIAARDNIAAVDVELRPLSTVLREGWHFFIPFAVLLFAMFEYNSSAELAALYGAITIVSGGFIRKYKGHGLSLRGLLQTLPETGTAVVELTMIVAGAGLVIGLLNISSGGFALALALVHLGNSSLALLLLVSAGVCILLGMGMPTSGVYVLLAALVAPSLIESGIEPLAAHMFILYFGMMSMITPPIALAAFSAATISGDRPMQTGVEAMRLGWVSYLVPLLFIFSPALLMQGSISEIAFTFFATVVGVYFISVAIVGCFLDRITVLMRAVLLGLGVVTVAPVSLLQVGLTPTALAALGGIVLLSLNFMKVSRKHA